MTSILLPASCGVLPDGLDHRHAHERHAALRQLGQAFDKSVRRGHGERKYERRSGERRMFLVGDD